MKTILSIPIIILSLTIYAKKPKTYPSKISEYNYFDFMDKYGENDTSAAIIDLFLNKRNEQGVAEMSFFPITSSIAIIAPPIGIPLTLIYSPIAIHGCFLRVKYSKKRLEKTLKKYNKGERINKHLTKKINKHYQLIKLDDATYY